MPYDARSSTSIKLLLYEFEMMSDLKINFHKSFGYKLSRSERLVREPPPSFIAILVPYHSLTLGFPSKQPLSQGKIGNHLLRRLRENSEIT